MGSDAERVRDMIASGCDKIAQRVEAQVKRIARLEAALREIAGATKYRSHPLGHEDMVSDIVVDIAKEALEETK